MTAVDAEALVDKVLGDLAGSMAANPACLAHGGTGPGTCGFNPHPFNVVYEATA